MSERLKADIKKNLSLLFHQLDEPVFAARAARLLYSSMDVFSSSIESEHRSGSIHPSALGTCTRMAFMELKGLPRLNTKVPPHVRRAGLVGTVLHSLIQNAFETAAKASGLFTFEREVPLSSSKDPEVEKLLLGGSCDGCLGFEGRRLNFEIKGLGQEEYSGLTEVREKDLMQASMYQHYLGAEATWFIYVSRRSYTEMHYIRRIPDEYWRIMRKRVSVVLYSLAADLVPAGTADAHVCQICAFEPACPHPRTQAASMEELLQCLDAAREL